MLKLISLAMGLITVISMAPTAKAISATNESISLQQPAEEIDSQLISIKQRDRRGSYGRKYDKDRNRSRYDRNDYRRNGEDRRDRNSRSRDNNSRSRDRDKYYRNR
jgi:hypothetical protein